MSRWVCAATEATPRGARGLDAGGGLAFTDAVTGLSLDLRVRSLVMHQAEGVLRPRDVAVAGVGPTPSSPLGLTARVAPSWGGQARGGAEALWGNRMAHGVGSRRMHGSGGQINAEVGYGLPLGARLVGTPRVGLRTSSHGRDYQVGYGIGLLERGKLNFELGVEAQRRVGTAPGGAEQGVAGRLTARLVGTPGIQGSERPGRDAAFRTAGTLPIRKARHARNEVPRNEPRPVTNSPRTFFRQAPADRLARYSESRGLAGELDLAAWLELPGKRRNALEAEFRQIFEMSSEKGVWAILDEAR